MVFREVADGFAASRQWDSASLSRLAFWVECLGECEFASVTVDDVDDALVRLAERGRLRAGRRATERSGRPLKGATIFASTSLAIVCGVAAVYVAASFQ